VRKIIVCTLFLLLLAVAAPTFVHAQDSAPSTFPSEKWQKKEAEKFAKQQRKEQKRQEKQARKDQKRAEKDYKLLHPSTRK
jgi:hypothetical protein